MQAMKPKDDRPDATSCAADRSGYWDRVNFGRVLHRLRTQAGLTQAELGERMGRDRRRVMVLEQGIAVREPQSAEIALLAASLGGGLANKQLATAARPDAASDVLAEASPRERVQRKLGSDFGRLLCRVDDVRDGARSLARAVDQLFSEDFIPNEAVQRCRRPIATAATAVLDELHRQTRYLGRCLATAALTPEAAVPAAAIVDFREAQSRYWSRCAGVLPPARESRQPDQLERCLDILEMGTLHLHAKVSQPASTALSGLGHLFLFWAELAMRAAADLEAQDGSARSRARLGDTSGGLRFIAWLRPFKPSRNCLLSRLWSSSLTAMRRPRPGTT